MSVGKHHNTEYSGGFPVATGDRYYSQDLFRDFNYLQDRLGEIGIDIVGEQKFIVSGGVVSKGGSADEMNITACVAYAKYAVSVPNSFASLPPSVSSVDIEMIRIVSTQQTNLDISGATLDGSTTNYVKLAYDDANGNSRTRAKKAGSYNYEHTPSFTITVDDTGPTAYEVVLLEFKWDGVLANVLEIIDSGRSPNIFSLLAIKSKFPENDFINGSFDFWQRKGNTASFAAIATGIYSADRMVYTKVGAMVHTITRDTDVPGSSPFDINYSFKVDCTTVDAAIAVGDFCTVGQRIEGYNFKKYVGGYGTLSFWVKGTKVGTHCVSFRNSVADRSYVAEYQINVTNTWEFKTITIPLDYSAGTWDYINGIGLEISWALASGSTFHTTPDAWQTGDFLATADQVNATDNTSNDFFLAKVKFELGQIATPFVTIDVEQELARCQRYFEKSYDLDIDVATNTGQGLWHLRFTAVANADHVMETTVQYKATKRAVPTVTAYSQAGTVDKVDMQAGEVNDTIGNNGMSSVEVSGTNGAASTERKIAYHWTSDAEL